MSAWAVAGALLAAATLVAPAPGRRLITASRGVRRLPSATPTVLVAAATVAVAALTTPAATFAGAMTAALTAIRRRRNRRLRERRALAKAMVAALQTVVGELRAGAHPVHAFATAAGESDGEVASVLGALCARARLGADVVGALDCIVSTSAVPEYWLRVAVCWRLATEHGLPMSTLMHAAQQDLTERQRFADRLDAQLAGARATAAILAGLPLIGVALGQLVGANPVRFLLGGGGGGWLLVVGVALMCVGIAWSDRLIDRLVA